MTLSAVTEPYRWSNFKKLLAKGLAPSIFLQKFRGAGGGQRVMTKISTVQSRALIVEG